MSVSEQRKITIDLECDRRINFAMQQNDVPVVKALRIRNEEDDPIQDVVVSISTEPAFARQWTTRVARVPARGEYHLAAVDLALLPAFLGELTEGVRGTIQAEGRLGDERVAEATVAVQVLAHDEWGGLASLPEILAAFVVPNHPGIEHVLRGAANVLEAWTGDPSLNGYESRSPRRAYMMAAAVYVALQKLDLTYINPPASFESDGQRVRLPHRILDSQMGTCLDVALLAAGCLEQAGLNPLILLVHGHAFVGVWLREECFPESASDDGLRIRKRVELNELLVFDPTAVTARPMYPFDRAVTEGKRRLDSLETFLCAIDVQRARKGQIRPLPVRSITKPGPEDTPDAESPEDGDSALHVPNLSGLVAEDEPARDDSEIPETAGTRLDRWRRKLLDLSLRNRLLNFRETKKTVPLMCSDLGVLEDMLAGGTTFSVLPRPADLGSDDPRDAGVHAHRTGEDAYKVLLAHEMKARRLYAHTSPDDLDRRLVEIYRAARLGLEEGGASALYLAVGFLKWFETDESEQQRRAPILLLPLELTRKSVREGFALRLADDEARINVTLIEMLKQDHAILLTGLDPLPEDESGLDVLKILRTVRQAVRDIDRWEVVDEAWIGLFSFTKFLMWRDLSDRVEDLLGNAVVSHLVNRPDEAFDPDASFPVSERLDDDRSPDATFCPLPADSSQLAAVFAAADGRSFVLKGPPGTGKSQTITNLIAHCLAEGKTVLFVSEKMAALNVVHRRLENVGLGPFCLELHSNKIQKQRVIEQLDAALSPYDGFSEEDWTREAMRLAGLRNELNAYVRALHARRSTGETAFEVTSRLVGLRDVPVVDLGWSDGRELSPESLADLRDSVDRLITSGKACGSVSDHPWSAARREDWSLSWDREVQQAVDTLGDVEEQVSQCAAVCGERLGLGVNGWSSFELDTMDGVARALLSATAPSPALLTGPDWGDVEEQLRRWVEHGKRRDESRRSVRRLFRDEILRLDLDDLKSRIERAETSPWPFSWWRGRFVRKQLQTVAISGKLTGTTELGRAIEQARQWREEQRKLDTRGDEAREWLGRYWNDGNGSWDDIERLREWAQKLRTLAATVADADFERSAALRERWARLATEGQELLRPDGAVGRELDEYTRALEAFRTAQRALAELLDCDETVWGAGSDPDALGRVRSLANRWKMEMRQLRWWCAWRRTRADGVRIGVTPLIDAYERGTIEVSRLAAVFERSFGQWWIASVLDQEPVLREFFSPEHDRKIAQFRQSDDAYMHLTESFVRSKLAQRIPASTTSVLPNSELGILKREIGKRRRRMSVRRLLQTIPNLLLRLKPCLLMSPMSVAQYLATDYSPFDVVVFDEASQIPVWDAVGAIARGHQAVIVGDPKQLPPTNFFNRTEEDEEAEDDGVVEDLESILDDCIAAQIPCLSLDWHYRSRHESLIAFSNYHYYGNRLLTFPSPVLKGLGVTWHPVPQGVYDKGKSRTNRAEAEAVVSEIARRLHDPDLSEYSCGVVTFSQAQQTLIEDLLDAKRRDDPGIDRYFAEDADEPVFVKNLENVQGDERDVILFSICYGPDLLGRVSMNFGPMNRDGGERRLNVAITRARREVMVFSTLRPDQINLVRTRARGVRDLKSFLEYAEHGTSAIAAAALASPDADFDSPFEQDVFDALVDRGWEVHKQVGCAGYRIDLAVVDPESPGRYLLGIECDGANYHRARTARDRDKLRAGVLRDLGWKLHRIWSSDWWTDPKREMERLVGAIERVRNEPDDVPDESNGQPGGRIQEMFASSPTPVESGIVTPQSDGMRQVYEPFSVGAPLGTQADFYELSATPAIRTRLIEVVEAEGPISLVLATKRVAASWGLTRAGSRIQDRVRQLVRGSGIHVESSDSGTFLWPARIKSDEYTCFRVPDDDAGEVRAVQDIPVEELANALLYLLEDHRSAPADELIRETARLFGFQRLGHIVERRIQRGIIMLAGRGRIRTEGDAVVLGR